MLQIAEVMHEMVDKGDVEVAAQLMAELAQHVLSVSYDTIIQLAKQARTSAHTIFHL